MALITVDFDEIASVSSRFDAAAGALQQIIARLAVAAGSAEQSAVGTAPDAIRSAWTQLRGRLELHSGDLERCAELLRQSANVYCELDTNIASGFAGG
jgi:WXG100 family type VII secretion target